MPLDHTPARFLKLEHACDQWHSSRKFTPLTGVHCKLRPNTEGEQYQTLVKGMSRLIGRVDAYTAISSLQDVAAKLKLTKAGRDRGEDARYLGRPSSSSFTCSNHELCHHEIEERMHGTWGGRHHRPLPALTMNSVTTLQDHRGAAVIDGIVTILERSVRCAFVDRNLHSRMPLDPTHVRLKLLHPCDQWHSSRVSTRLTGWHCKLRRNTEGAT
jgi:hypothetical protein